MHTHTHVCTTNLYVLITRVINPVNLYKHVWASNNYLVKCEIASYGISQVNIILLALMWSTVNMN